MNKYKRNDPCYCGSGRKYKKCCLNKDRNIMETKPNTFAKEVQDSKITPAEEMQRNQAVHLITLRSEKEMITSDAAHLLIQVDRVKARRQVIAGMADCECRTASMATIDQRIQKLEEAIEATKFNGLSEMTLDALEQVQSANESRKEAI